MKSEPQKSASIEYLTSLGPEVQGVVDESLLAENLKRTPYQRIVAASEAATQVEELRRAMRDSRDA